MAEAHDRGRDRGACQTREDAGDSRHRRTAAKGHILQPQWDGTDSIRERYEAVRPLLRGGSVLDVGCASRYGREDWLHACWR